jgi:hypothetical protein
VTVEQKTGSLFNFLVEDEPLVFYSVNPAMVAQYRRTFHPSGAKDDPSDTETEFHWAPFWGKRLLGIDGWPRRSPG